LLSQLCFAQIPGEQQRQLKYWYYRERLKTRFMINIGPGHGEGMPSSFRNDHNSPGKMQWGADATIDLAYYIITLATEYDLLSQNGQNTDATLNELFYAVDAINRLDYYCEAWWGTSGGVNGFFMRDDCCFDCWDDIQGTYNSNYFSTFANLNIKSGGQLNGIESEWIESKKNNKPKHAMSIDQVLHIYLALCVVANKVQNISPPLGQGFIDGSVTYSEAAQEIMKRVIDYIHDKSKLSTPYQWKIFDPVGNEVLAGPSAYLEAAALSKANKDLCSYYNPKQSLQAVDPTWGAAVIAFKTITTNPWVFLTGEGLKFLNCMTFAGPSGNLNNFGALPFATKINLWSSHLNQKWPSVHIPLLNQYLYGTPDYHGNPYYRDLLDEAPCFGPYNYSEDCEDLHYQAYNWSSTTLLIHPERRGGCGHDENLHDPRLDFAGDYNGLDYMVIYNLFCLTKNEPIKKYFFNLYDNNMLTNFPTSVNYGSTSDPADIISHNTITASNHISSTGDVEYRAGKSIDLTTNFTVDAQAQFYAHIDDVECVGGGEEFERIISPKISDQNIYHTEKRRKNETANIEVTAFPIPFSSSFNLSLIIDKSSIFKISLKDAQGKLITILYDDYIEKAETFMSFSTDNLELGFYLITVESNENIKSVKLIKTK